MTFADSSFLSVISLAVNVLHALQTGLSTDRGTRALLLEERKYLLNMEECTETGAHLHALFVSLSHFEAFFRATCW